MAKNKQRWKDLSFEDKIEKQLIRQGLSKENAFKWKDRYKSNILHKLDNKISESLKTKNI